MKVKDNILEIESGIFNALAHPLRLKILEKLRVGPCCVCKIIPFVDAEQSNVSHHLAILKNAGVVRCEKRGLEVSYEVVDRRIFEIIDTLEECVAGNLKKKSELLREMARR
ncbi:MAG: metalloregulator ArsR/SmtB family transcription factor [candidate division WOR-3 bacterium]